jgi:three-Cys-motif partner protein
MGRNARADSPNDRSLRLVPVTITASDGLRARDGGAWTREKLVYLRKYATAFMVAMSKKRTQGKWNRLIFIDLLCGPGIDVIDGEEHQGSPLIALSTIPQFDHLFLGDIDAANVAALRERISSADQVRVSVEASDCHTRAGAVVEQLAEWGELGFAFVDPEGFEVRFDLFATLARRPVDILFLFPSGIGIKRNLARFAKEPGETPMDRLWGNRSWRLLPIVRLLAGETISHEDAENLEQSWGAAFRERVAILGYPFHVAAPPLRNDQNVPMYHLLFFSRNQAGLTIWRGIGRIEPDGQRRMF